MASLMETLDAMSQATFAGAADDLTDLTKTPGVSANLCEGCYFCGPQATGPI